MLNILGPMVKGHSAEISRAEMLQALQNDVNAWPTRVKEAGVTNLGGAAYIPLPRNNEILRTRMTRPQPTPT